MSVSSNIHEEDSRDLCRELEEHKELCDDEIDYEEEEEEFPTTSIRVLLVDADPNSSLHMKDLMTQFSYQVTNYENGEEAIDLLKKSKHEIDLVIWDFHNHVINGVKALKIIRKEMDLPVVILSSDYERQTVKKSMKNGACDFLVKPVSKEVIAVLWQHVFRKRMSGLGKSDDDDGLRQDNNEEIGSKNIEDSEKQNTSDRKGPSSKKPHSSKSPLFSKKPRMTWTPELHKKFEIAINNFGSVEKAYPRQILNYMQEELKVEGIDRGHIASHLQKYRLNCGKRNRGSQETRQEDLGWQNATFTPSKSFLNPTIDLHARVSYTIPKDQATLAAANSSLAQYPLNVYNSNHFMTNPLPNFMSYTDHQFYQPQQQPQPQPQPQQQQQYQYSPSYQLPTLVTKQESGYISTSSAMENHDELIYDTNLPYDPYELFLQGYNNNIDQTGR